MQTPRTMFWLLLAGLVLATGAAFWPEVSETWEAWVGEWGEDGVQAAQLPLAQTDSIVGFRQGVAPRAASSPMASNLQTRRHADGSVLLRFDLSWGDRANSADQGYPSLAVYFFNSRQQVVRTLVLNASQYVHRSAWDPASARETIALNVRVLAGETGYTVQAFYPDT